MTHQPKEPPYPDSLKAHQLTNALRGYIKNGILHVLDHEGQPIPSLRDVMLDQPMRSEAGKFVATVTLTAYINLYESQEQAQQIEPGSDTTEKTSDRILKEEQWAHENQVAVSHKDEFTG